MEQNVARSRTCGEVLWCEVRFFFRVFSRVFLRHPFLHIREVSLVFSSLSVLLSALLFSYLPSPSPPSPSLLFHSLSPFPPFPLSRKHNHNHNHKHHQTTNIEPPTYKMPLSPPPIPSHPIPSTPLLSMPKRNPNTTSIYLQKQKIYHSSRVYT